MNSNHLEELAALDALDALDGEDTTSWQRITAEDETAMRLRDQLADAAAALHLLALPATAPASLRRRVMNRVFETEGKMTQEAAQPSLRVSWAAAAAVALLALAGATAATRQTESVVVRDMRPNPHNLNIQLAGYGDYAQVRAGLLWDSGQRGWYLQASGLPGLPQTHRYRVWAVDSEGTVHDCGELPLRSEGQARRFVQPGETIDSMQGFAVSIEPVGSLPSAPTSPAVLISAELKS